MRDMIRAIRLTLILGLITGIIYPLIMLGIGLILPAQANGSLIQNAQGQIIGSALIGQPFASERYFSSRPSTVDYSTSKEVAKTGISGASNLAPTNPNLIKRIGSQVQQLKAANIAPNVDLIYTSGSGLDPHITIAAANAQIERVARARSLSPDQLKNLITQNTDPRFLGIFGEPRVNVLKLNLALDSL
jgi:potassium-transporting ATPase KdpC subunit